MKGRAFAMNIASMIDHTNLNPDATLADIKKLCEEAKEWHFASVCVNSSFAKAAAEFLKDSGVRVCCVVGFPLGANADGVKAFEAAAAQRDGAAEIDMVINISYLKDREHDKLKRDIMSVVEAVPDCPVKVIIETCLLSDWEKVKACEIAKEAGARFVKTSTGFSKGGATIDDVVLMRRTVGDTMGVKASGGIRDRETAEAMINAGADRIGASRSVEICGAVSK